MYIAIVVNLNNNNKFGYSMLHNKCGWISQAVTHCCMSHKSGCNINGNTHTSKNHLISSIFKNIFTKPAFIINIEKKLFVC